MAANRSVEIEFPKRWVPVVGSFRSAYGYDYKGSIQWGGSKSSDVGMILEGRAGVELEIALRMDREQRIALARHLLSTI